VRGRWAAGIVPRNFCWIIRDYVAVSERPGGYAPNHRKVRRQEELLWLRAQGFTRVVSLLGSTHNLHAYEELGLEWSRFPMPSGSDTRDVLTELYPSLRRWLRGGERVLLHQEELGDRVMGVAAGYLLWSEILPDGPRAITCMEQLLKRQMGTVGRTIVTLVEEVPPWQSFAALDDESSQAAVDAAAHGADGPGVIVLGGALEDDDLAAKIVAETTVGPPPADLPAPKVGPSPAAAAPKVAEFPTGAIADPSPPVAKAAAGETPEKQVSPAPHR
jgi:hypothetical protein